MHEPSMSKTCNVEKISCNEIWLKFAAETVQELNIKHDSIWQCCLKLGFACVICGILPDKDG